MGILSALDCWTGSLPRTLPSFSFTKGPRQNYAGADDHLAEIAGCLVLRFAASGLVTSVSSNCRGVFGLAPGELMGRGFVDRVQVADRPAFLQAISRAAAGCGTVTATLRWRGPEPASSETCAGPLFLWFEMRARRGNGSVTAARARRRESVIALFRDITEAMRRSDESQSARPTAFEEKIAREHFLARACHEIRAPLNAIAGFAELLANAEALPERETQRDYARIIHQSAQHLLSVVDSVTEISLLQSGQISIGSESFDAAKQIELCCDMFALLAKNKGVRLLRTWPADLGPVTCDRRLFTQILVNLISNAVKFKPPSGRVAIAARAEAATLTISITDTGIGIDADDLCRLGDPFFQVKSSCGRLDQGTGLGLSIVCSLLGLLGGEIMLASEPAKGSCVQVRVPMGNRATTRPAMGPVRIATAARLPLPEETIANLMMVKKIA